MAPPRRILRRRWLSRWKWCGWGSTAVPASTVLAALVTTTACAISSRSGSLTPCSAWSVIHCPTRNGNCHARAADQDVLHGRCDSHPAGADRCPGGVARYQFRLGCRRELRGDSAVASSRGRGDSGRYPPLAQEPAENPAHRRVAALPPAFAQPSL